MTDVQMQDLSTLISKEVELMTLLLAALKKEEQVLVDNESEKLEQVVAEKNILISDIIALEKKRNQLLSLAGYSIDRDGMNSFLTSAQSEPKLQQSWDALLELSAKAKENNRTNGLLINRQMVRNQTTLNILQQNDQSASVYGADGQSKSNATGGRGFIAG